MNRINLRLGMLVLALAFTQAALALMHAPHEGPPKNILLISIDTLRADYLGCSGGPAATPNLDWLAAHGTLYERAYSQCDRTAQSHMSMLTSRYVSRVLRATPPSTAFSTLPEILQQRGYHTVAIPSCSLLDSNVSLATHPRELSFGLGFDEYFNVRQNAMTPSFFARSGQETNDIALSWLSSPPSPWFMWLHYYDVHGPRGRPATKWYARAVTHTDALIGKVLDTLRASGQIDNTIVVITSDHGEGLGEHDMEGHAGLYDTIVRVPLIVRVPGEKGGVRVSSPVENIDVAPTLLGGRLPGGDGRPLPTRTGASTRAVFAETRNLQARMTARDGMKLIEYDADLEEGIMGVTASWASRGVEGHPDMAIYRRAGLRELFDGAADPMERRNVLGAHPDQVEQLSALGTQRLGKLRSATVAERMRAVGY